MSDNQNNIIINEVKNLIKNVNEMIKLHTEVMNILMDYYNYHNYKRIREFKEKASAKVDEILAMTEQALEFARGKGKDDKGKGKMKAETSGTSGTTSVTTGGSSGRSGRSGRSKRSRVKKSTVQYEIDDILTGGYWKEMKKKK